MKCDTRILMICTDMHCFWKSSIIALVMCTKLRHTIPRTPNKYGSDQCFKSVLIKITNAKGTETEMYIYYV